ncbi:MAG: M56 family metallopeptidase [Bacteroidales bacterium]
MNPLLIYMFKSGIYLAGFYLVYFLFLSKDASYSRNRAFILGALIISSVLPLFKVSFPGSGAGDYIGKTFSGLLPDNLSIAGNEVTTASPRPGLAGIISAIYLSGLVLFGLKLLFDLAKLVIMISANRNQSGRLIRFSKINTAGFSAFGFIFINENLPPEDFQQVYRHECNHLRQKHFYDILLIEILTVLQWFNPVIHLVNISLRSIHEYQADRMCLDSGSTVTGYQKLLFGQLLKSHSFLASNTFSNPSLLKKRMIMMTKKTSRRLADLKVLIAIPVILLVMFAVAACSATKRVSYKMETVNMPPPSEDVFVVVEEMPVYPGGDKALMEFINSNIQYPKEAKEKNIQGRVICRFCVRYDGTVDRVAVLKSVDPSIDAEAIRVLKLMNNWTPGKQGGKPVSVWYSVPVTFELK